MIATRTMQADINEANMTKNNSGMMNFGCVQEELEHTLAKLHAEGHHDDRGEHGWWMGEPSVEPLTSTAPPQTKPIEKKVVKEAPPKVAKRPHITKSDHEGLLSQVYCFF